MELLLEDGSQRSGFVAASGPLTSDSGEIVVGVALEEEYPARLQRQVDALHQVLQLIEGRIPELLVGEQRIFVRKQVPPSLASYAPTPRMVSVGRGSGTKDEARESLLSVSEKKPTPISFGPGLSIAYLALASSPLILCRTSSLIVFSSHLFKPFR